MAARVFLGTSTTAFNLAANWDGGLTVPSAGDTLTFSATCILTANETLVYGATVIDATFTLDLSTFNLSVGSCTANGTLKIGVSGGTGLTCVGMTFNTGSTADLQTTSIINNSGFFTVANSAIWASSHRGVYTQTGSSTYSSPSTSNYWYSFTQNAGVTTTFTSTSFICNSLSNKFVMNGTFAIDGFGVTTGATAGASPTYTWGASSNITGTAAVVYTVSSDTTVTIGPTLPLSWTGTLSCQGNSSATRRVITGNFSNNFILFTGGASGPAVFTVDSGTLTCTGLSIFNGNSQNITVDNSTNNPNFTCSLAIDLNTGAGTYTTTWTKGTGTITMTGSSGTNACDFDGKSVEDIVLNCAGATKTIATNFTTDSLSGSGGTLQSNSAGTQRTITVGATGVATGCTFKDISLGAARRVNAKSNCTNNGNNLGFVFIDKVLTD